MQSRSFGHRQTPSMPLLRSSAGDLGGPVTIDMALLTELDQLPPPRPDKTIAENFKAKSHNTKPPDQHISPAVFGITGVPGSYYGSRRV